MKKIILLFLLLLSISFAGQAQGNLQFNQVIRYNHTGSFNGVNTTVGTITVPAGKVWKIESAYGGGLNLFVDGQLANGVTVSNVAPASLPIWLAAGTYTVFINVSGSGGNYSYTAILSGIEFNVIP